MRDRGGHVKIGGRMNTTSPLSFLESLASRFQPPAWAVDEGQHRLVLFLNHVLMQEKQAQDRLVRQKGRVVHLQWGVFSLDLLITPAGLVDRASPSVTPDLRLVVEGDSPLSAVQSLLSGQRPPVTIEGDVQLAADIGWLAENLRWDVEEDLSRVIGDVPAHALGDFGRRAVSGLRDFLRKTPFAQGAGGTGVSVPPVDPAAPASTRASA